MSSFQSLNKTNKNVLSISKVVGASACVPGLFPAVYIAGELLVDGGVADNQGLMGLIDNECDTILVSDASGQLEIAHQQNPKAGPVVGRTMGILQHQVRVKLLEYLSSWQSSTTHNREFASLHLLLNIKEIDPGIPRVPDEFIPPLARIRTDLDQFDLFEREVLMYHGYTLIDVRIQQHCSNLWNHKHKPIQKYLH